jgi:hypothetical protein
MCRGDVWRNLRANAVRHRSRGNDQCQRPYCFVSGASARVTRRAGRPRVQNSRDGVDTVSASIYVDRLMHDRLRRGARSSPSRRAVRTGCAPARIGSPKTTSPNTRRRPRTPSLPTRGGVRRTRGSADARPGISAPRLRTSLRPPADFRSRFYDTTSQGPVACDRTSYAPAAYLRTGGGAVIGFAALLPTRSRRPDRPAPCN